MCCSCGCYLPANPHGNPDNITIQDLMAAAQAQNLTLQQVADNINGTLKQYGYIKLAGEMASAAAPSATPSPATGPAPAPLHQGNPAGAFPVSASLTQVERDKQAKKNKKKKKKLRPDPSPSRLRHDLSATSPSPAHTDDTANALWPALSSGDPIGANRTSSHRSPILNALETTLREAENS